MPPYFSSPTQSHSLLSSETVEIIAESGQKSFFIHSDILIAQSGVFRSTIGAQGSTTGKKIDLSDWDAGTVKRFLQFLYFRSYEVSEPVFSGEGTGRGPNIPNMAYTLEAQGGYGFRDVLNLNVLLVHAEVYVLAQYKDVGALQVMAFERLRTALGEAKNNILGGAGRDLVELLRYFCSPARPDEKIRDLVSTFAAEYFEVLMDLREMRLVLHEGGDFVVELMGKVAGRIYGTESEFVEIIEKLRVVEKDLQNSKRAVKSRVKRRDSIASPLASENSPYTSAHNTANAWKWRKHLLGKPILHISGWPLSTYRLFCITVIPVVAFAVILFIQYASYPTTIDGNSFEGICQYYKGHSWPGSDFVVVGGKTLKEACNEHIPGTRVHQPSPTTGGTMKDICHFYEATSWTGGPSIGAESLKEACTNEYLTEGPRVGIPAIKNMPSTAEPTSTLTDFLLDFLTLFSLCCLLYIGRGDARLQATHPSVYVGPGTYGRLPPRHKPRGLFRGSWK